jgi:predicted ArsR family transcriptional regulator
VSGDDLGSQLRGVGALNEPARRALYHYVASQPEAVSRDQAAAGTGLARHAAKFHLDKLVEEGLLVTEFRRLGGRRGPGAGRPSKLYARSGLQLDVTLPARRYELAGQVLAEAVSRAAREGVPVLEAVTETARRAGLDLAGRAGRPPGQPARGDDELTVLAAALERHGYEPRRGRGVVTLANCPFHSLAEQHRALVCGMNLALVDGVVAGLGCHAVAARLDPAPGRCCVTLTRVSSTTDAAE